MAGDVPAVRQATLFVNLVFSVLIQGPLVHELIRTALNNVHIRIIPGIAKDVTQMMRKLFSRKT